MDIVSVVSGNLQVGLRYQHFDQNADLCQYLGRMEPRFLVAWCSSFANYIVWFYNITEIALQLLVMKH